MEMPSHTHAKGLAQHQEGHSTKCSSIAGIEPRDGISGHDLRYPIGPLEVRAPLLAEDRSEFLAHIAAMPQRLRDAVEGLSAYQLDTPYRPEGWTCGK